MIRGLPTLYQKHIGSALNNQIWLVTHSDVFLRAAFYDSDIELFHMAVGRELPGSNQITRISQRSEFDRACIELIGDIANYRPDQLVLIVEGQQQFDILVLRRLFSEMLKGVNVLEAGGKQQVLQRQVSLRDSAEKSGQTKTITSITDSDGDRVSDESNGQYQWSAYHIENYLIEPKYIGLAIDSILANTPGDTSLHYVQKLIHDSKNQAASETGQRTLVRRLKSRLNGHLQIKPGATGQDLVASELRRQLQECKSAINAEFDKAIEGSELEHALERQRDKTVKLQEEENTPDTLPGRDVLRKIAVRGTPSGNYETLRNAILNEVARDEYQPPAMRDVLRRCLSAANAN